MVVADEVQAAVDGLVATHGRAAVVRAAWARRTTLDDVVTAIRDITARDGKPPSIEAIAQRLDLARRTVRIHLDRLERDGRITRQPDRRNTIAVVEEEPCRP